MPFQKPMTFQEAILGEKWIRATIDGTRVALVGQRHHGHIVGLLALPGPGEFKPLEKISPHHSIDAVQWLLPPCAIAFVSSLHSLSLIHI